MFNFDIGGFQSARTFLRIADIAAVWCAGQVCGYFVFESSLTEASPIHSMLLCFCSATTLFAFPHLDMYQSWRGRKPFEMFFHVALSWSLILIGGVLLTFFIHKAGHLSRLWIVAWFMVGYVLLILNRKAVDLLSQHLRSKGLNIRYVLIIGYGTIGRELHRRARLYDSFGYEIIAVFVDSQETCESIPPGITQLKSMHAIHDYVAQNDVHEVWIALPLSAFDQLAALHSELRDALVEIRWVPDATSIQFLSSKLISFMGLPTLDLNHPASSDMKGLLKDFFDRVIALSALVCLSPVLLAIAIAIKLSSPGPILFSQTRLGLNGKKFKLYKFRSMHVHHEGNNCVQAKRDDPRITWIGSFLRRTSLDELPQFVNVLKGEMSVVGPRPHAIQHNDFYRQKLETYMLRHRVKPGITGWAQINGYRGETETVEKMASRVQLDIYYIQHWSLLLDLKIIAWTALNGWTDKNAY